VDAGTPAPRLRDIPAYLLLVGAEAISVVALFTFEFAVIAEATFRYRADARDLGVLGLVSSAAFMLGALVGGMAADRLDAKWALVVANASAMAALVVLLVSSSISHLILAAIPFSTGNGAMGPARSALLRQVVSPGQLLRANSAISFVWQVSIIAVPPIAGSFAERGALRAMIILALMFLVVGLLLFSLVPHTRSSVAGDEVGWGGVKEAWLDRNIRPLVVFAAFVWFLTESLILLEPLLVRDRAQLDQGALGVFWAMRGAGGLLLVAIVTLAAGRVRSQPRLLGASAAVSGLAWLGFASASSIVAMGASMVVFGGALAVQLPLARAYLQGMAARVGQVQSVFAIVTEIGTIGAGAMVAAIGPNVDVRFASLLVGLALAGVGLLAATRRWRAV
jgi:MFS family permease